MEHIVYFTLNFDPPPENENLPHGAKKGDKLTMVNVSVIWWDWRGRMRKEYEYGRIGWANLTTEPWDTAKW